MKRTRSGDVSFWILTLLLSAFFALSRPIPGNAGFLDPPEDGGAAAGGEQVFVEPTAGTGSSGEAVPTRVGLVFRNVGVYSSSHAYFQGGSQRRPSLSSGINATNRAFNGRTRRLDSRGSGSNLGVMALSTDSDLAPGENAVGPTPLPLVDFSEASDEGLSNGAQEVGGETRGGGSLDEPVHSPAPSTFVGLLSCAALGASAYGWRRRSRP